MAGSVVRQRSSTPMKPRVSALTRVYSRPSPALAGCRPTATSTRSKAATPSPSKRASIAERRHSGAEADLGEELLAPAGERVNERAVDARKKAVGHLRERDRAAQRGVDLPEREADVAAADHEEPLGHVGQRERRGRVDDAIARECEAGQAGWRRARGDDGVLEAHFLRLVAFDTQLARALEDRAAADHLDAFRLRDRREPAREAADDPLGFPLAQGVERHPRFSEVDAELAGALGVLDERGDVEQRLRRDAALPEAGAAEALASVHDDRLEPQLGAAERRRVATGSATHHGDVDLDHEVAHHHGLISPSFRDAADRPGASDQTDAAVGLDRQGRPDALTEGGAALLAERHAVPGRGRLPAEERRPVVVEVLEDRRNVDRENADVLQAGALEELDERRGPGEWKPPSFVELERTGIEGDGRVPEAAHELHLTRVVPNVRRRRAS